MWPQRRGGRAVLMSVGSGVKAELLSDRQRPVPFPSEGIPQPRASPLPRAACSRPGHASPRRARSEGCGQPHAPRAGAGLAVSQAFLLGCGALHLALAPRHTQPLPPPSHPEPDFLCHLQAAENQISFATSKPPRTRFPLPPPSHPEPDFLCRLQATWNQISFAMNG